MAHTRAAAVAASSAAALAVSVRRNSRMGVCRLRVHAVRVGAVAAGVSVSVMTWFYPPRRGWIDIRPGARTP